MRNETLIKNFNYGETKGHTTYCESVGQYRLHIIGNVLYSYRTPIAIRLKDGNVILNKTKYSSTTSHIQSKIRYECNVVEDLEYNEFMKKFVKHNEI